MMLWVNNFRGLFTGTLGHHGFSSCGGFSWFRNGNSTQGPLGTGRYSFSKARTLLCLFSASICSLSTGVEIAFESLPPRNLISWAPKRTALVFIKTERKSCCDPRREVLSSPRSPVAWSTQALSSGSADREALGCFAFSMELGSLLKF